MAVTGISKWVCSSCTYHNWSSTAKCVLCGCPKPNEIIPKLPPSRPRTKYVGWPAVSSGASYAPHIIYNYPKSSHTDTSNRERSSESSKKWICSTCTYGNWPNANQCTMCKTPKGEKSRSLSQADSILDYASYVGAVGGAAHVSSDENLSAHSRDSPPKMKSGKNGNKLMSENRSSRKWKCHRCTYENWPRAPRCIMCQSSKKRTPSPPLSDRHIAIESPPASLSIPDNDKSPSSHSRSGSLNANEAGAISTYTDSPSPTSTNRLITFSASEPPEILPSVKLKSANDEVRQIRNRLSTSDWLFLTACLGVVNDDEEPVKTYLWQGGDRGRQLSKDECLVLGEPSKFTVGSTPVHLAIRFQRTELLSLLLTPASSDARKRLPSQSNPDLASSIREEVALCLRQHKGDWPCYFFTQLTAFTLPPDICKFCLAVQKRLMDEVVDRDVEKELEVDSPIINWSGELTEELGSRLFPLWNRTAGDCLLDSVLQATWGVVDRDMTLRRALADSLVDGASRFYERWKEAEQRQSHAQGFSLDEEQLRQDWMALVALADQKGKSLEQTHILALAHILRRPIIVYGVKVVKNFRGENLGFVNFEGVYLPLLWESSFCWKSPVALAYTRGHFSALVSMSSVQPSGAGVWSNRSCDTHVTYLPLVDCEGRLLPVHFLTEQEVGCEERLLNEYCECHVTRVGTLTAKQEVGSQHQPTLVVQLVDEWLDRFRRMDKRREAASCTYDSDI